MIDFVHKLTCTRCKTEFGEISEAELKKYSPWALVCKLCTIKEAEEARKQFIASLSEEQSYLFHFYEDALSYRTDFLSAMIDNALSE